MIRSPPTGREENSKTARRREGKMASRERPIKRRAHDDRDAGVEPAFEITVADSWESSREIRYHEQSQVEPQCS